MSSWRSDIAPIDAAEEPLRISFEAPSEASYAELKKKFKIHKISYDHLLKALSTKPD